MSATKRKFTREFKTQVVSEIESGLKTKAQATREYELSEGMVNKWVRQYQADPQNAFRYPQAVSEMERLKSRIIQLETALGRKTLECEILKTTLDNLKVKKGVSTQSWTS